MKLPIDYWVKEILSSTWAVIEREEEVLGIAAAKLPHREMDNDIEDHETARFIESLWIAPELRGYRMGERLVRLSLRGGMPEEPEYLAVSPLGFRKNRPAIHLYRRMGFEYTAVKQWLNQIGTAELKYQYRSCRQCGSESHREGGERGGPPGRPAPVRCALPDIGSRHLVSDAQVLESAREGLEVREPVEIAPPLGQVCLPQVDKPLAELGLDPVQLTLSRADGCLSGANLRAFPGARSGSGCRVSDSATLLRKSLRLSMKAAQ